MLKLKKTEIVFDSQVAAFFVGQHHSGIGI